ncbi:MAG: cytochrome c [Bacteroidota bacterium]
MKRRAAKSFCIQLPLFFSVVCLSTCSGSGSGNKQQAKYEQYYVQGNSLYKTYCNNCHQEDGAGLGKLIPPLKSSDYLLEDLDRAACIIKNGQKGKIIVNGVEYNQPMPANQRLTPLEIAELVTYITNAWDQKNGIYEVKQAEEALSRCNE